MQYQGGHVLYPAYDATHVQPAQWQATQAQQGFLAGPQSGNQNPAMQLAQFVAFLDERSRADAAAREAESRVQQERTDRLFAGVLQTLGSIQATLGHPQLAPAHDRRTPQGHDTGSFYSGGTGRRAAGPSPFAPFDDGSREDLSRPGSPVAYDTDAPAGASRGAAGRAYDAGSLYLAATHDPLDHPPPRAYPLVAPRAPRVVPDPAVRTTAAATEPPAPAPSFTSPYAPRGLLELLPVTGPLDPADPSQRATAARTVRELSSPPRLRSTGPPHVRLFLAEVTHLQRMQPEELHELGQFLLAACSSFFPPEGEASLHGADSRLAHVLSDGAEQSFFRGFRFGQLLELLRGYALHNAPLLSTCVRYVDPVLRKQEYSLFTQSVLQQLRNVVHILASSCLPAAGASRASSGVGIGPDDDLRASVFLREHCVPPAVVEFVRVTMGSVNLALVPALDVDGDLGLLAFLASLSHPSVGLVSVRQGARSQLDVDCYGARMAALDLHRSAFGSDGQHDPTLSRPLYPVTPLAVWRRMSDSPLPPGVLGAWMQVPAPSGRLATAPVQQQPLALVPRGAVGAAVPGARASIAAAPVGRERAPPPAPVAAGSGGDAGRSSAGRNSAGRSSGAPHPHPPTPLRSRADAMGLEACRQHIVNGQCRCVDSSSRLHVDQVAIDAIRQIAASVGRPDLSGLCIPYALAGSGDAPGSPACACRGPPPAGNCSSSNFSAHPPISGRQSTVFNEFVTRMLSAAGARHALPASISDPPGRGAVVGGHAGAPRWGAGGPEPRFSAPPLGSAPPPRAPRADAEPGHPAASAPPTAPPTAFMITRGRVHASSDPSLPMLIRLEGGSGQQPECTAEVGPFAARVLFDTGADSAEGAYHFVSPSFLSRLVASGSSALATLGFSVRTLPTPVTRLTANGIGTYTQAAVIPVRVYLLAEQEGGAFVPRDIANETDSYLVLPELPDNIEYPHDLVLASPAASAPGGRQRWTTTLRLLIESGTAYHGARVFPSLPAGPSSILQMVRNLGAVLDPATGLAVHGLLDDDDAYVEGDAAGAGSGSLAEPTPATVGEAVPPSVRAYTATAATAATPAPAAAAAAAATVVTAAPTCTLPPATAAASEAPPAAARAPPARSPDYKGPAPQRARVQYDSDDSDDSDEDELPALLPVSSFTATAARAQLPAAHTPPASAGTPSPSATAAAHASPLAAALASSSAAARISPPPVAAAAVAYPAATRRRRSSTADDSDEEGMPPLIPVRGPPRRPVPAAPVVSASSSSPAGSGAAAGACLAAPSRAPSPAAGATAAATAAAAVAEVAAVVAAARARAVRAAPAATVAFGTSDDDSHGDGERLPPLIPARCPLPARSPADIDAARPSLAAVEAESAAAVEQISRVGGSIVKALREILDFVAPSEGAVSPATLPLAALHVVARLTGSVRVLASQVKILPPDLSASHALRVLSVASALARRCAELTPAHSDPSYASDLHALVESLRSSAAVLAAVGSRGSTGTPGFGAAAPSSRGRAPDRRVAFAASSAPSDDARSRRRPVSAPAPSRPVSFAAMASASPVLDDGDLCMAGFPTDAVPRDPTSTQDVSDADIHARFDWDAITDGGRLPWLADEVWAAMHGLVRSAAGAMPPTAELPWSVAFRLRDGARPPFRRQPLFKPPVMAQLRKQVRRLFDLGVIEEVPEGVSIRCNNMLLMVPKPHTADEWRLVVDLSGLNAVTVCDEICTLPKDLLALMQQFEGCRLFSSLDLRDAYYMMALLEECRNLTIVTDPCTGRRYRFTRAVMGGRDMGIYLHKRVNSTVKDAAVPSTAARDSVADDILVGVRLRPTAPGVDVHVELVRDAVAATSAILRALVAVGGRVKLSKCFFLSRVGQLVGFVTDGDGVRNDPARLEHLRALALPSDMKSARRFLGLILAYSRFVAGATESLLCAQRFVSAGVWPASGLPADVSAAFGTLRDAVADNVPLRLVNRLAPVHARSDASGLAAGGHIGQYDQFTGEWVPLGFFHHAFSAVQRRYSTNVRELLALALLVLRYAHLLRGCRVVGWVDHHNLLHLCRSENPRLLRIGLTLLAHDLDLGLMYDPGFRATLPDTLSRSGVARPRAVQQPRDSRPLVHAAEVPDIAFVALSIALAASAAPADAPSPSAPPAADVSAPAPHSDAAARSGVTGCAALPRISSPTERALARVPAASVVGLPAHAHPIVHAVVAAQQALSAGARRAFLDRDYASEKRLGEVQVLLLADRLFVPSAATEVQQAYLSAVHDTAHPGAITMVERLRDRIRVVWDSLTPDATRYVRSCGECQHVAAGTRPAAVGRMTPYLYLERNDTLLIDFYGPLPVCRRAFPLDTSGTVHSYAYIVTLVDGYSRFVVFLPATNKSADTAVAAFRHWCTCYGAPRIVRSDSDKAFLSALFQAALLAAGSAHDAVPPYTHHQMGLLERAHKPLGDFIRRICGLADGEWVSELPLISLWINTSVNRHRGTSGFEAFLLRQPVFAYDRLSARDVVGRATPDDVGNIAAALDVCVRTASAVAAVTTTAEYDSGRQPAPRYAPGDLVLVFYPSRENKLHTLYRGPFSVLSQTDTSGNYFDVYDLIQLTTHTVHVERMKPFDMSRSSLPEQAGRQLPSRDFGIVVAVDGHQLDETLGELVFAIRFYAGATFWRPFSEVAHLDVVKRYVADHGLETRKLTPAQQYARLTGRRALSSGAAAAASAPAASAASTVRASASVAAAASAPAPVTAAALDATLAAGARAPAATAASAPVSAAATASASEPAPVAAAASAPAPRRASSPAAAGVSASAPSPAPRRASSPAAAAASASAPSPAPRRASSPAAAAASASAPSPAPRRASSRSRRRPAP